MTHTVIYFYDAALLKFEQDANLYDHALRVEAKKNGTQVNESDLVFEKEPESQGEGDGPAAGEDDDGTEIDQEAPNGRNPSLDK